jgi:hypothetical protein
MKKGVTGIVKLSSSPITEDEMIFAGGIGTANRFGALGLNGSGNASDGSNPGNNAQSLATSFPVAGTLKNLQIIATDPSGAETATATLFVNGAGTALAVTLNGGSTQAINTTDTVAVGPGDLATIHFTKSGGAVTADIAYSAEFIKT